MGLDLLQTLKGRAWDAVEDTDIATIANDKCWTKIITQLDSIFKYDQRTELPTEFENLF